MTACPSELELARAISDGANREIEAHLAACTTCSATWNATTRALELARRVEVPMPDADRREEMRTAILAAGAALPAVARARSRPHPGWLVGGALAAAAVLVLVLGPAIPRLHTHGTITARAGARFVRSSPAPDEIVTLQDGVIDVEVSPLSHGERFRVIAADTEIEVRGTAFEVATELGHVTHVQVRHGLVEVRPRGGAVILLGAGEAWRAPVRTAMSTPPTTTPPTTPPTPPPAPAHLSAPSGPAPSIAVPVARSSRDRRATPTEPAIVASSSPAPALSPARSPTAIAYDQAWDAMRSGRFDRASSTFARVAILDPDGPLAEDASYWYPVALARAKRSEAVDAFRDFLARYPSSSHASEASVMLGWLLVDTKQPAEAEKRFRAAVDDPSAAVRDSARAGLAAVLRR